MACSSKTGSKDERSYNSYAHLCGRCLYLPATCQDRSVNQQPGIPEIYVRPGDNDFCVLRMNVLPIGSQEKRKTFTFSFVERAYQATGHWKSRFVIAAIDYAFFSHMDIVVKHGCQSLGESEAEISSIAAQFSPSKLKLEKVTGNGIVAPVDLVAGASTISLFTKYRSKSDLQSCSLLVHLGRNLMSLPKKELGELYAARYICRFPLRDLEEQG